jgi:hypothetical protein
MTISEIEAELAHWTFMPGWTFRLDVLEPATIDGFRLHAHGPAILRITAVVPNSYRPGEMIQVESSAPVPVEMFEQHPGSFVPWLQSIVHDRMCHEADEWLKRDGVMAHDPHAKERRVR